VKLFLSSPKTSFGQRAVLATLLVMSLCLALPLKAESPEKFEHSKALEISQAAIGVKLGEYHFTTVDGQPRSLTEFQGKPLVISLVFTSCYQVCPMTTRHLAKVVSKAREALGQDSFNVLTIGFDAAVDDPAAMQHFAVQQGIDDTNWQWFSIAAEDVAAFTKDLGFIYFPSARGFDHIIQATVVDAEGIVYRQVYGQAFETPLLVEPLKQLILGSPQPAETLLSSLFSKIRFFCTTYDPSRDGYYFDYSLFIGMFIGAMIIILTAIWLFREILYRKRLSKS